MSGQMELFGDDSGRKRRSRRAPSEWKIVPVRVCESPRVPHRMDEPRHAVDYWRTHVATAPHFNPEVECFVTLLLNTRMGIKGHHLVSIGSLNETVAHPREVFRAAVIGAAHNVILMHNHPSGDPSPSTADTRMTRAFAEAGSLLRINVTDHIIVGYPGYFSFRESGLL